MATTPSHGMQAGLLAYYGLKATAYFLKARLPNVWKTIERFRSEFTVVFIIAAAVFGMLPDLLGIYGHANAALDARALNNPEWMSVRDWNGYYARAHNSDLYEVLKVVPFYALHIWVDKFFHEDRGGWSMHGYVLEVILDLFMITLLWMEVRKRRHIN